jgi:hypothetical protein
MNTTCPHCQSSNTARCEMIYLAGTSRVGGRAVGITLDGAVAVGGIGGRTQTGLAQSCRPPRPFLHGLTVAALIVGAAGNAGFAWWQIVGAGLDLYAPGALIRVCLFGVAGAILGGLIGFGLERATFPYAKMTEWRRRWICTTCGTFFSPHQ